MRSNFQCSEVVSHQQSYRVEGVQTEVADEGDGVDLGEMGEKQRGGAGHQPTLRT